MIRNVKISDGGLPRSCTILLGETFAAFLKSVDNWKDVYVH